MTERQAGRAPNTFHVPACTSVRRLPPIVVLHRHARPRAGQGAPLMYATDAFLHQQRAAHITTHFMLPPLAWHVCRRRRPRGRRRRSMLLYATGAGFACQLMTGALCQPKATAVDILNGLYSIDTPCRAALFCRIERRFSLPATYYRRCDAGRGTRQLTTSI